MESPLLQNVNAVNVINEPNESVINEPNESAIIIDKISDNVLLLYQRLQEQAVLLSQEVHLFIHKARRVGPRAIEQALLNFQKLVTCPTLKTDIAEVIAAVMKNMHPGDSNIFVCHNTTNANKALEFVCLAVSKYLTEEGEVACDYCMSTYTHVQSFNKKALALGGATLVGATLGVGGAVACSGGSVLLPIAIFGSVAALGIAGTTCIKCTANPEKSDTRDTLVAYFLKELVNRGHANLQEGGRLIITNE